MFTFYYVAAGVDVVYLLLCSCVGLPLVVLVIAVRLGLCEYYPSSQVS